MFAVANEHRGRGGGFKWQSNGGGGGGCQGVGPVPTWPKECKNKIMPPTYPFLLLPYNNLQSAELGQRQKPGVLLFVKSNVYKKLSRKSDVNRANVRSYKVFGHTS
jgi:hypothetical protein